VDPIINYISILFRGFW